MFVRRDSRFLSICLFGLSSAWWTESTSSFRIVKVADPIIPSMDTLPCMMSSSFESDRTSIVRAVVSSRSFLLYFISNLARSSRRICSPVPLSFVMISSFVRALRLLTYKRTL